VIRASIGRSFGAITTVTGSTHQRGFTQVYGVPDNNTNGVQPNMILKEGFPQYPVPPFIDPSFANKDSIPWWQGKEATRFPETVFWNLSIQRQIGSGAIIESSTTLYWRNSQSQLFNPNSGEPASSTDSWR
jgi:hypothetical protein